jgi:hypothetical protein
MLPGAIHAPGSIKLKNRWDWALLCSAQSHLFFRLLKYSYLKL